MARHCYVLRVFTRGAEGGNPLGVVTDSSGLPPATMQEIATELGFSETIYLNWEDPALPRVRIFTPAVELPFAGHPLVGITWLLHRLGPGGCDRLECGIGRVDIRMEGEMAWVDVAGGQPLALGRRLEGYHPGATPVSSALVEMPLPYYVIELPDSAAVAAATMPERDMLSVYTWLDGETIHTRFFAPGHGVEEDPATGSAAVAIAATLVARGRPSGSVTLLQGEELGSPSAIAMRWDESRVSIGGTVVRDEVRWLER